MEEELISTVKAYLANSVRISNLPIPIFNGEKDVQEFITKFEDYTKEVSEKEKANLVPRYLAGSARNWFENSLKQVAELEWSKVKQELLHRYASTNSKAVALERLRALKCDRAFKK